LVRPGAIPGPGFRGGCDTPPFPRESIVSLRIWARAVKRDTIAVFLAARDPRVPWYAKAVAMAVAGYALSPIDLIPDFIPVIGYLDDVILVPLGIALVRRLIPAPVFEELRAAATRIAERPASRVPASRVAGAVIVMIWIGVLALGFWWGWHASVLRRSR
jgi:uncharacterized membrane protein YkvA (DUF1232 family)